MAAVAAELGEENVMEIGPLMGFEGEDFADNPANHTPQFGPVMEPTLTTGVHAALAGLLHYVGR